MEPSKMSGFWNIPNIEELKTPILMLKEQASELTDATDGILVGHVAASTAANDALNIELIIKVPALGGYQYTVLTYEQPITIYPGRIYSPALNSIYRINDDAAFISALKDVIQSPQISQVVKGLLSQAKTV